MKNNFYFKEPFSNIYKLPNIRSEVTSQILYGERFKILSKRKGWIKIKSLYDRYSGFIKDKKYVKELKISHKVRIFKQIYLINQMSKQKKIYILDQNYQLSRKEMVLLDLKKIDGLN